MSKPTRLEPARTISGAHLETAADLAPASEPQTKARGWRSVPLKWRIAALTALLLAMFAAVLSGAVIAIVTSSLEGVQRRFLEEDTSKAQRFLENTENGSLGLESRPLGSSRITLFSAKGNSLGGPPLALPEGVTGEAAKTQMFWSSENGGRPIRALLTPIKVLKSPSVLAVWTEATYIRELSSNVRSVVTAVTVLLILAALLSGYVIAFIGLRPLVTVARQATRLDEHHLEPLSYDGPRDELGLLSTTLNQMVSRLKRAFDAQKTFLAETSHELRTPLTALQGYLRIAAREATPEQKPVLEDAQRVTDAMTRLVGDLLQLSRGDVVREWVPHVVDLGEVARNVAREFGPVNVSAGPELEMIGDPDRLAQLVRNLISNAVRAAGKPEGVHLSIKRLQDKLELHVTDDGPGIPEHVLPRIFEKFYKGPGGGAGLGLAIVAQIARVHGGEITATNDPGGGAHFVVTLPALQDEE
jgi:two-component system, OmpR family, sensor kinase